MKQIWSKMLFFFAKVFDATYTAQKCGHKTKLSGSFVAFGEKHSGHLKLEGGKVDYCIECIRKMTIRCAWCGKSIVIGDPVTLYMPNDKGFVIPDYATVYQKEPLQLVGCLRWGCADTGADRAGFWVAPGRVLRVLSPIEKLLVAAEKGKEEPIVIVSNLADINEALQ